MKRNPVTSADSNYVVEQELDRAVELVEKALSADALGFRGPLTYGLEDYIRDAVEGRAKKKQKMVVILETTGGYIEVAQRIADTVRHHYPDRVEYVIPDFAMSAGTVLVMSGDAIHMDYYSVLGPIDPQVENDAGHLIPALGYLLKYEELIEKSKQKTLTTAELQFLIQRFDPAELYSYEQAKALSNQLLKQWLVKYKFKDWNETETSKTPVTLAMKETRASEIADALNNTTKWNSHARPISMEILRTDLKLKIEDFGVNPSLSKAIKCYHRLLRDYMARRGHRWAIHTTGHYTPIGAS